MGTLPASVTDAAKTVADKRRKLEVGNFANLFSRIFRSVSTILCFGITSRLALSEPRAVMLVDATLLGYRASAVGEH